MAELKCGYCREATHRRPVCPKLHHQRMEIYNNTVDSRKSLYARAIKAGFANGAIVQFRDWGVPKIGTVLDLESSIPSWDFYNYRKVLYSKQVACTFLNPNDTYTSFCIKVLVDGNTRQARVPTAVFWGRELPSYLSEDFKVLSSSHDEYEVSDEVWSKDIEIHRRLGIGSEIKSKWGDVLLNNALTLNLPYVEPVVE